MKLEHYPIAKLKREILSIVGRHLDLTKYRVFFFGSRVKGGGTERSDIDVGIEGPEPVPGPIWLKIQDEIEEIPTLYKIELVDFKRVTPEFRTIALEHVEPISEP